METGHDIIFFWVARMILMTTYVTGSIPFKEVFLHGLVTTPHGKKMSKSDPESMVDPLRTIADYGADATRFGLMYQMTYGSQAIKFDEEAVKSARNFANKIWNIARFIHGLPERDEMTVADQWIEGRLADIVREVTRLIDEYRGGEAARLLYNFIWSEFADWYVEVIKVTGSTTVARRTFLGALRVLHPFMPYITEVLWQQFDQRGLLASAAWPDQEQGAPSTQSDAAAAMAHFQDIVIAARSARALFEIEPKTTIDLAVTDPPLPEALAALCHARLLDSPAERMRIVPLAAGGTLALGATELTDEKVKQAQEKLSREEEKLSRFVDQLSATLAAMRRHAPRDIVEQKEVLLQDTQEKLRYVQQSQKFL
jgi:valyl-tRNA synthetase